MMTNQHKNILILADIEGSSNCTDYRSTKFLGKGWPRACRGMTKDVDTIVKALFESGVERVMVKDFHRTGFNLISSDIDRRAKLVSGYFAGPVPGIGDVRGYTGVILMGMHAPSGAVAFLPHTLTSRMSRLEVNGKPMTEAELFCASLAPFNIVPLLFSGCPVACDYAAGAIPHIRTYPIIKNGLNSSLREDWRQGLAARAVDALENGMATPYMPKGPFQTVITFREGRAAARKAGRNWALPYKADRLHFESDTMAELYKTLIRVAYFNPMTYLLGPVALPLFNLMGRIGLACALGFDKR